MATWNSGTQYNMTSNPNWTSSQTTVATVSSGLVTGKAPGSLTVSDFIMNEPIEAGYICVGPNGSCLLSTFTNSAGGTVVPTVTISYNPGYVYIGQGDPTVAQANLMGGTGTPSGGTYQWSSTNSGISFDNTQGDPVHITASTYTGGTNDTPITLNYTYNSVAAQPATVNITKRIFKYLAGDSVILLTRYNGPSTYGYLFQASYNVFANPGGQQVTNVSGISTYENVTQTSSNGLVTPNFGQGALNANSQLVDNPLSLLSNSPLPANLKVTDSQDIGVGGIFVRNNTLTWTATTLTVTSNGPSN